VSDKSYLVAGLGNIGLEYANTRHNIGFIVLDAWAKASNTIFSTERYGDVATIKSKGREFHLLKPSTYMNLSGNAVRYWMQKLDVPVENILVICDDINLPFGTMRMRKNGSDGGHNGLKNIEDLLQTRDYSRLRLGVGHEFEQGGQIDFVLGKFTEEQLTEIEKISEKISQGINTWAFCGIEKAMNLLNVRPGKIEKCQE